MPRVLIVEDEPLISLLLEDWLGELGHEAVGPVSCVNEGVKMAGAGTFDAGLLDINLGAQRSDPIAEILVDRKIPFAFMTGGSSDTIGARFSAHPKLLKPFNFDAVSEVLNVLMGARKKGQ